MGKLLRLNKEFEDAERFYKIGLKKSNKKDPLYVILEKQLKTVKTALENINFSSNGNSSNNINGKGHLLSMPINVLNEICCHFSRNTLKTFSSICKTTFSITCKALYLGALGGINLRKLKSSKLYSKVMKEYSIIESFKQSSIFSVNSESSTLLFLVYLKNNLVNLKKSPRITNLVIGPLQKESFQLFMECLNRGLSLTRLKIDFGNLKTKQYFDLFDKLRNLKELILINSRQLESDHEYLDLQNLESLNVIDENLTKIFSNCKSLKYISCPNESNFNIFLSEKIILANLRYCQNQNQNMRPRPIKYLSLNGNNCSISVNCIDLTQYSYESIEVLHLDSIIINNNSSISITSIEIEIELIKSSCWLNLNTLRISRLMLNNSKKDLTWILSKCPNLRVLEIISLPLAGLNDFNTKENGIWLIDLIFKTFLSLEHLILGDLTLGPLSLNYLMKKLQTKSLNLKVFGLLRIQSIGYNFDQLYQTFKNNYPWSYLLTTEQQYEIYCEEYNLFKQKRKTFIYTN